MPLSRREFIKQVGIAFASLILTQCKRRRAIRSDPPITCYTVVPSPTPTPTPGEGQGTGRADPPLTCYTVVPSPAAVATPTPTMTATCYEVSPLPTETPSDPLERKEVLTDVISTGDVDPKTVRRIQTADARERLRACWTKLDELAQQAQQDIEGSEKARDALAGTHRAVLDELVSLDELDVAVAALVQDAFDEGAYHVWRLNVLVTCYIALPIEYDPREDLIARSEALSALSGDVDPKVLAEAQEALARDIAFFSALDSNGPSDTALLAEWQSHDIEAGTHEIEAARFLGELLSGSGSPG